MQRWWRYALMVLYAGALWAQQERTAQLQRAAVLESVGDYEGAARLYRELCQRMLDSACVHGLSRNLVKLGACCRGIAGGGAVRAAFAQPPVYSATG
jgi:hypothetical protein